MLVAVDLSVAEVVLVGEVCLEAEVLTALAALEALLVEDDLVDRSHLLHLVDAVAAARALVGRRRNEQVAQSLGRCRGGRDARRHGRHWPVSSHHQLTATAAGRPSPSPLCRLRTICVYYRFNPMEAALCTQSISALR